jgi:hypothetical protein
MKNKDYLKAIPMLIFFIIAIVISTWAIVFKLMEGAS